MATLTIEGQKVQVDDSFLSMSPQEQEATVEEIAASLGVKSEPQTDIMGNVNRGIAQSIGGLVDFVNPFDQPHSLNPFPQGTGSAQTGLGNVMEAGGVPVAEGEPRNVVEGFARGTGQAAGALPMASGAAAGLRQAPGLIGQMADDAYRGLASLGGSTAEVFAGGLSGAAEEGAEQAGAPEWVQNTAAIAAPMGVPAAMGAAKYTPGVTMGRQAARSIAKTVAPYTGPGGREVARQRVQGLAGGPERAEELSRRITGDSEIGLSPARETGDPNMLGLEELAQTQDPNLRARMEAGEAASRAAGRQGIEDMGGDVGAARDFIAERQRTFARSLNSRAEDAVNRANERLRAIGPNATEGENSRIVMEELERSLSGALTTERRLWESVPRDAVVPTQRAKETAQRLIDDTPRAQQNDVPRVLRDLLASDEGFADQETVREMHGLYSELRRVARSAMAGNDQNKNLARIANETADAILDDLGATDAVGEVGQSINEARAFSAALHEAFDQGTVGRLRKRTIDGDTATEPELALQRSVGRGGEQAGVASRQIRQAAGFDGGDMAGNTGASIEDYTRDLFSRSVENASGEFTPAAARNFLRDNQPLLEQYPDLRQEIAGAVSNRENAEALQTRVANVIKRSEQAKTSALAGFLNGPPEKAINAVFNSPNPIQSARVLRNAVGKDDTGQALAGLKGAFADRLIAGSTRSVGGGTEIDPNRLTGMLEDKQMSRALGVVFDNAEMNRLRRIAKELSALDATGENVGTSLSGATPNTLIEYAARVVAARQGADLGGGGGGSIQTAQMASNRTKEILGRLVSDKASQIIADAIEDPELFRALLTDVGQVNIEKQIAPRFIPYLVGGAAAAQAQE